MVQKESQTTRELVEALIKDMDLKDFISDQQIGRALGKEMKELTNTMYDYIDKYNITQLIKERQRHLMENSGNPLFLPGGEDIQIHQS